jgi:CDP-diacylglycerol---serine O-phosphatidyltransferase
VVCVDRKIRGIFTERYFSGEQSSVVLYRNIPNFITLGNLLCGCIAVWTGDIAIGALLIIIAAVLDFFDGLMARALNIHSDMGKELDSLADLVTFGLAPAILIMRMNAPAREFFSIISFIPMVLPVAAAWRLARFNIDEEQSAYFKGLPAPANGLFWAFTLLWAATRHESVQSGLPVSSFNPLWHGGSILLALLMVSKVKLLNFKVKDFRWKTNSSRWVIVIGSALIIALFSIVPGNFYLSIPACIMFYVQISFLHYHKKTP